MTRTWIIGAVALLACARCGGAPPEETAKATSAGSAPTSYGDIPAPFVVEWEIVFEDGITTEEYARQIDFFKIEIAAVAKNGKIEYISNVASRKPAKRVGHKTTDYRLHIPWKRGNLHVADRKLLAKVGIVSEGKELSHYFPIEAQAQLSNLERAYAGREPREIKSTIFEVRPKTKGEGYEFVVIEQDPPKPADSKPAPAKSSSRNPSANQ